MGDKFRIIPHQNVGMVLTRLNSEGVGGESFHDGLGIWVESRDMRESVRFPNEEIVRKYFEAESEGRPLHLFIEKENKAGWKLRFPRDEWCKILSLSEGNFDLVESKEGYHLLASIQDIPPGNLGVICGHEVEERLKVMSAEANSLIPSTERGVGSPGLIFVNELFFAGVTPAFAKNVSRGQERMRMVEMPSDMPDDEIKAQLKDVAVDTLSGDDDGIHIIHVPEGFMRNDVFRLNPQGDGNAVTRKLVVYRIKDARELIGL